MFRGFLLFTKQGNMLFFAVEIIFLLFKKFFVSIANNACARI